MEQTRSFLSSMGLPSGDCHDLPSSISRFEDGGQYRFEVPGIQNPESMRALLNELSVHKTKIHRVTQTKGIMLLSDEEILAMTSLAKSHKLELVLAVGPRATYDTSATVQTKEGQKIGYRLRGQDQIVRAIEDIKRAVELGCNSFLLYDEGCLWILNEARRAGEIPPYCKFKMSAHSAMGIHALQNY